MNLSFPRPETYYKDRNFEEIVAYVVGSPQ